jgi:uncharacterized membrane-anchored protein
MKNRPESLRRIFQMNESQKAQWEQTRTAGYWRYVLQYWVVLWGGSMMLIESIFNYFSTGSARLASIEAPVWLLAGFIGGSLVWFIAEYRYRKASGFRS